MIYSPPKQRVSQDSDNKYKNEWAMLLDMHQKESELETVEIKRENQLRKLKYREELEKMIENQRAHHVRSQDEDAALLRMQAEHDKLIQEKEFQKNLNLKDKMYSCEVINRNEIAIRHRKQEEDKQKDLQLMQKVIRQASTEQQQESKMKQEQKLKAIQDLNSAYQKQEGVKALEKVAEKNKDRELMQQQLQQINAVDQSRKQFMDKIKGGFKKNDKVENYYMQLHQQKMEEDQQFQHKYIDGVLEQRQRQEEERQMAQARKRQEQSYKTLNDNMSQIEGKKIQQQQEHQFEQQYSQVVKSEAMQYEAQQKALADKMKSKQKDYFEDLKVQVEVDQAKKRQEGFMNPTEYNLNKNQLEVYSTSPQKTGSSSTTFIPIVPGIIQHRDYQRQKQLSMIDNKLGLNIGRSPNSESQRDLPSQTNSQHRRIKSFATQGQNEQPNNNAFSYNEVVSQNNPDTHSLNLFPNVPQLPSNQPPLVLSQSQQFSMPKATPKLTSVQSLPGQMPQNNYNNNQIPMANTMPINQQQQFSPQLQPQYQQQQAVQQNQQYQQPSYQMNQQQYQQKQNYQQLSPRQVSQINQPQQQQQFPQIMPRKMSQNVQPNNPQGFAQNYLQSPAPLVLNNPYQNQFSPVKQQSQQYSPVKQQQQQQYSPVKQQQQSQQYFDYKTGSVPPLPRYTSSMGSLPDASASYNNNNNTSPLKLVRNSPIQMINRNSPQKDQQSYLANQGSRVFE